MFELEGYLKNYCWGTCLEIPFFQVADPKFQRKACLVWYFLGVSQNARVFYRQKHPRNQNKVAKQKCMPILSTTTKQTQTWSLWLGCWWISSRIKVADCLPVMLLGSIHKERPLKMLPSRIPGYDPITKGGSWEDEFPFPFV